MNINLTQDKTRSKCFKLIVEMSTCASEIIDRVEEKMMILNKFSELSSATTFQDQHLTLTNL